MIPVLLCSGYTGQHLSAELTLGNIRCLHKPYTAVELAEAVASTIHRGADRLMDAGRSMGRTS